VQVAAKVIPPNFAHDIPVAPPQKDCTRPLHRLKLVRSSPICYDGENMELFLASCIKMKIRNEVVRKKTNLKPRVLFPEKNTDLSQDPPEFVADSPASQWKSVGSQTSPRGRLCAGVDGSTQTLPGDQNPLTLRQLRMELDGSTQTSPDDQEPLTLWHLRMELLQFAKAFGF